MNSIPLIIIMQPTKVKDNDIKNKTIKLSFYSTINKNKFKQIDKISNYYLNK